jgi:hypothetical protein
VALARRIPFRSYAVGWTVIEVFAPVFATLALGMFYFLLPIVRKIGGDDDETSYRLPFGEEHYQKFITTRQEQVAFEAPQLDEEGQLHDSFQIEPFLDILEGHDLELKINAIGKLSAVRTRESITLLRHALNDGDYEVKYFANNSLALMEQSLVTEIEALSLKIERYPWDHTNLTKRGLGYLHMYYLGIIEKAIGTSFLARAMADFRASLVLEPGQEYLKVKVLEIHTHAGEFARVLELTDDIDSAFAGVEERVKAKFYRAEALFRTGQYEQLPRLSQEIRQSGVEVPLMTDVVDLWLREVEA